MRAENCVGYEGRNCEGQTKRDSEVSLSSRHKGFGREERRETKFRFPLSMGGIYARSLQDWVALAHGVLCSELLQPPLGHDRMEGEGG